MEGGAGGMDAVITSLTSSLSAANLWGIVGSVVPFLAISVLFGLGFYLVKRILNKTKVPFFYKAGFIMSDIVCNYLIQIINISVPCIFLRMVLDAIRNYIFKN